MNLNLGSSVFEIEFNPTKNNIVIKSVLKGEVEIRNILGETIITSQKETESKVINISDLASGIYILRIGKISRKFFKNK